MSKPLINGPIIEWPSFAWMSIAFMFYCFSGCLEHWKEQDHELEKIKIEKQYEKKDS